MSPNEPMTFTLTEALILAGAAVMLALLLHGWWIARRARPRDVPEASPLRRSEPGLGLAAGSDADGASAQTIESVLDLLEPGDQAASATAPHDDTLPMVTRTRPRRASLRLDPLVDVLATLHLDSPVSGEAALAHLPPSRRAGSKPFAIEGLNTNSGEWESPTPGERYGEFQAGLQLANRSGPLSEIEFSEWVQKVQSFADSLGATPDFPDMLDAVARARELDAFAGQHDAQMAFHLRAKGAAWTLGFVQQAASKLGLVAGSLPGRMVLPAADDGDPPLLWLQVDPAIALAEAGAATPLRDAALMFDVAQTAEALEPFSRLQELGRRMCRELDAELLDEAGRPLGPHAFAAIDQQLSQLYKTLASRDLAAGSVAARRLFS